MTFAAKNSGSDPDTSPLPATDPNENSTAENESVLQSEQSHLTGLYQRLDQLRENASDRLVMARRSPVANEQELSQRDVESHLHRRRMATLDSVEDGLCFGRLDFADSTQPMYVGRIGMRNEDGDPLLVDWRAEAARRFYLATAANPQEVYRRRHLYTSGRRVQNVHDEILDLEATRDSYHEHLGGQGALLAALNATRSSKMQDIVATIQAEQDRIIRAPLEGTLVVDGAPGTGKTAVALHRAAYLLYEHRDRLSRRGVLIVGPGTTFLDYISEVLPGLAETDVLLRTPGQLLPGLEATRIESEAAAALKGDQRMAESMVLAVADRQEVPAEAIELIYDTHSLWLRPEAVAQAREAARATEQPHNQAQAVFIARLRTELRDQFADIIGADPLGGDNLLSEADRDDLLEEITSEKSISQAITDLWPTLTPTELLADLYASEQRLEAAMPHLDAAQRAMLRRDSSPNQSAGAQWSPADVALLDEVANLLDPDADDQADIALTDAQVAYAQGVLDIATGSASFEFEDEDDSEILMATDLMDAALFGERHDEDLFVTVAERAARDRRWVFGHVIVDEAQELSPMMWRALRRRCVSMSFTVAGDLAQASSGALRTWNEAFGDHRHTWRREQLTVSYRLPQEIQRATAQVLESIDASFPVPQAVRESGHHPWLATVKPKDLISFLAQRVAKERDFVGEGTVGIVCPAQFCEDLSELAGDQVSVVTPRGTKGLEFDSVLLVDPETMQSGPSGLRDLYVALTRATQRLGVIHPGTGRPDFPGVDQLTVDAANQGLSSVSHPHYKGGNTPAVDPRELPLASGRQRLNLWGIGGG